MNVYHCTKCIYTSLTIQCHWMYCADIRIFMQLALVTAKNVIDFNGLKVKTIREYDS